MLFILPLWDSSGGLYGFPTLLDSSGLEILHGLAVQGEASSTAYLDVLEVSTAASFSFQQYLEHSKLSNSKQETQQYLEHSKLSRPYATLFCV